jgi:hypothetical protein
MPKRDDQNDDNSGGSGDGANEKELNKRDWGFGKGYVRGTHKSPDEQERPISDTIQPPED